DAREEPVDPADGVAVLTELVERHVEHLEPGSQDAGALLRFVQPLLARRGQRGDDHQDVVADLDVAGDGPAHPHPPVVRVGAENEYAHTIGLRERTDGSLQARDGARRFKSPARIRRTRASSASSKKPAAQSSAGKVSRRRTLAVTTTGSDVAGTSIPAA